MIYVFSAILLALAFGVTIAYAYDIAVTYLTENDPYGIRPDADPYARYRIAAQRASE